MSRKPLIGVSACTRMIGQHGFHIAGDKYLRAAAVAGVPLIIPALDELIDQATLLESLDGLLFTGSPSNVEPQHYAGPQSAPGTPHDPPRDRLTLPLIRAAVHAGIPVFGICRGFQEMNVAFGGSLLQKCTRSSPTRTIARTPRRRSTISTASAMTCTYNPAACSTRLGFAAAGARQFGAMARASNVWARAVRIEALAPDGLIEAFSVEDARSFALGVQWHPEWKVHEHPHYLALFQGFAEACRERARQR